MSNLLHSDLKFEYKGEPFIDDYSGEKHLYQYLELYADGERIFRSMHIDRPWELYREILEGLAEMALAILRGEYGYRLHFDDDDEGGRLGFIKAGRVLQTNEGVGHDYCHYVWPPYLVKAILDLLKREAYLEIHFLLLRQIKDILGVNHRTLIYDDPLFELTFCHAKEILYSADRLKIQAGDSFYYTDTVTSNILQELLHLALIVKKGDITTWQSAVIYDYNDDNPLMRNKNREYYRPFEIILRRIKTNAEYMEVWVREEPLLDESLIVGVDEFVNAVIDMVERVIADSYGAHSRADTDPSQRLMKLPYDEYEELKSLASATTPG